MAKVSAADSSQLFGTFADPTRLRILNLLGAGREVCVCDLCEVLGETQPKVSRHLAILRKSGLVRVRREGRWRHYALTEDPSMLQRRVLECVASCLAELPELAADRRRLAALVAPQRCAS